MSIRITTTSEPGATVIKIDGRLTPGDRDELMRVFRQAGRAVVLDLKDLQSIDRSCVKLLRESIAGGAALRGASPYVELLLQ